MESVMGTATAMRSIQNTAAALQNRSIQTENAEETEQ